MDRKTLKKANDLNMWIYKLKSLKTNLMSPECVISKCNFDTSPKSILSEFNDSIRTKMLNVSIKIIDDEIAKLEEEFERL